MTTGGISEKLNANVQTSSSSIGTTNKGEIDKVLFLAYIVGSDYYSVRSPGTGAVLCTRPSGASRWHSRLTASSSAFACSCDTRGAVDRSDPTATVVRALGVSFGFLAQPGTLNMVKCNKGLHVQITGFLHSSHTSMYDTRYVLIECFRCFMNQQHLSFSPHGQPMVYHGATHGHLPRNNPCGSSWANPCTV